MNASSPVVARTYDFPNAVIKVYRDRTVRAFPKWCLSISITRSRAWAAESLRMLRRWRRGEPINKEC